jgi:hypothetical protein
VDRSLTVHRNGGCVVWVPAPNRRCT